MLKEHERREYLKSLDQEKREREEKRLQELKEKHRQHPKVNVPVGTCLSVEEKLSRLLDVVSAFRAALLSCRRSGRRQMDSILWSSILKPSSNFTVSFFLLVSSFTAL